MNPLPSESAIRNSYREQAQQSQAHRWLALCVTGHGDRSDLLSADPRCLLDDEPVAMDGAIIGIAAQHRWSLQQTGLGEDTQLDIEVDGLQLPIARPGNAAHIHLDFDSTDPALPKISSLRLESIAEPSRATETINAQDVVPHRILALKHRWHALVEGPVKNPADFKSIMADSFCMDWGQGSVSDYEEFKAWLRGSASSVNAARHDIADFSWSRQSSQRYQAEFVFEWAGLSAKDQPMQARSRHLWVIEDDPRERYARIASMNVELLVPFHITTGASQ